VSYWNLQLCRIGTCSYVVLEPAVMSYWNLQLCRIGTCSCVVLEPAVMSYWNLQLCRIIFTCLRGHRFVINDCRIL